MTRVPVALSLILACSLAVHADSFTISGTIAQSTQDGTGPAVNNLALNSVLDGDSFTFTVLFSAIPAPGTYTITSASFQDPTQSVTETAFGSGSKVTVSLVSGMDQFSALVCLTTGSGCTTGNQADLNFQIPSAQLNGQNVAASAIPLLLPFELLEDDGVTDIHGTVATYSYSASASAVPEPGSITLLAAGLLGVLGMRVRRRRV